MIGLSISNPQFIIKAWRRGQVVRQGSAKPSSRVRIPSTPLQASLLTRFLFFLFPGIIDIMRQKIFYCTLTLLIWNNNQIAMEITVNNPIICLPSQLAGVLNER